MTQRPSNEKQTNMWHQIASSASNQRTIFVGFTHCRLVTLPHYQDGITNSEKVYYYVAKALFYMSM